MKYANICILAFSVTLMAGVASAAEPTFQELLEQSLPGMSLANVAQREQPQQRFQDACFALGTPGREAEREAACRLIAQKIGPETPKPARLWLLKQLEFIGRDECVVAVAAVLDDQDAEVRDWGRRALANNPSAEANAKLLEALSKAGEESWKIALVNAIGDRRQPASVAALASRLADGQESVASASAIALGKIGSPDALEALEAARSKAAGTLRVRMDDACLACADRLLANGKAAEAKVVYERLAGAGDARAIRLAAIEGRLRSAGDGAAQMILEMLAGDDADARAIAAGSTKMVAGKDVVKSFAGGFAPLPAMGKVLLLSGLAARGDKAAGGIAMEAASSDVPEVQLAGILALGRLGSAEGVELLVRILAAGGAMADPARASLETIYGPGVDEAIVARLKEADGGLRASLIDILDSRHATAAVPTLLQLAAEPDAGIRSRAIRTLANVAQPGAVDAMLNLLLQSPKGRDRNELEKAIMQVAGRADDHAQQSAPVLARLKGADEAQASILLPVLGRIGGPEALAVVEKSLASQSEEVRDAAVRALANWPDASVADQLMKIVDGSAAADERVAALRAYIRIISLPSSRPANDTLTRLKVAMEKSQRSDEKKLVLSRAASARSLETLRWVLPYVEDPELGREASLAVVELAHHRELMGPNHKEFTAALKKVTETCKDRGIVDRASRYMQGL